MKTNRSEIRKQIFDSYSKNLELICDRFKIQFGIKSEKGFEKVNEKIYVCPLCFKVFYELDLDQNRQNPLTIEDLPPKSIRKSILILTCKKCNNEAGYKFDYLIKQHVKTDPFLKGIANSMISANLNLNDKKYIKGQFKILEDKSLLFELPDSLTSFLNDSFENLIKNWSQKPFTLQFTVPQIRQVELAYLRIGYLIFFSYFGYLAVLDNNLKMLREQLLQPSEEKLKNLGIIYNLEKKNAPEGVHIIKQPVNIKTYLVVIDVSDKSLKKKIGILIPGPGEKGLNCYRNFISLKNSENLELVNLSSKDFLINRDFINAYYYFYENIN